jgi:putative methyltransferase (TIGR04325 family)
VCDVPEVVVLGRELAAEQQATKLSFMDRTDACAVRLAFGSLQYTKKSLAELLGELMTKPSHLIVNRTWVHQRRSYFTIQDIGAIVSVYHVFDDASFVQSIEACGYEL